MIRRHTNKTPRTTEEQYLDDISFFTRRNAPYFLSYHDDGDVFTGWYELNDVQQDISEYLELRQTNMDTKIHLIEILLVSNAADISLTLYRNPTFTPGTVPANTANYNHIEERISQLALYQDPTSIDLQGATKQYFSRSFGEQQTGNRTSFSQNTKGVYSEILLDPTADYLIELNNNGNNNVSLVFSLSWYETEL